jgi:hypothetical protein
MIDSLYATVNTVSELIAINTTSFTINYVKVRVLGGNQVNDGNGGDFLWTVSESMATNNLVYAPLVGPGRWFMQNTTIISSKIYMNASSNVFISTGIGPPEGSIVAGPGSIYMRQDGIIGTECYYKTSGVGNTGWSERGQGGGGGGSGSGLAPNPTVNSLLGFIVSNGNNSWIEYVDPIKVVGGQLTIGVDPNAFEITNGVISMKSGINLKINQVKSPDATEDYNFLSYLATRTTNSIVRERDLPYYREAIIGDQNAAVTVNPDAYMIINQVNWTVESVKATLDTPQATGATLTLDVWQNDGAGWTSLFSTPITIDNGKTNSISSSVIAALANPVMNNNSVLKFGVTQVGDGTAKGAKVFLKGKLR